MADRRNPASTGERRQLSAFFCDLVGSTELTSALDPEDWWDVLRTYHECVSDVVTEFGGHVAQYQGDGLLAYFGYPRAYENSPERAVRAGLAAIEALGQANSELERRYGVRLSLRVGIHTGRVVVAETGAEDRREVLAMGETVNLASRIEGVAQADNVVMSGDTEALVRGRFEVEDLGLQQLKGISRPIRAYRVLATTGVVGRLDLPGRPELTPFVGREEELGRLLACWDTARGGRGQVAIISGEPGIGKSRLARALRSRLEDDPHLWLEAQCSPWMENSAFYPVIELHRRGLGLSGRESPGEILERFETALADSDLPAAEVIPLLAALHDVPLTGDYAEIPLSREAQRRKTFEALTDWVLGLARERPVVLLVEDLQWVDPSTSELFERVLDRVASSRLFVVFTHRTDFEPAWPADAVIRLDRLAEADAQRLVREVNPVGSLAPEWIAEIANRAGGVPFFLEELTKAAFDAVSPEDAGGSAANAASVVIPPTLHDSLMARLDQLGPAKRLAQMCAAIGRDFSHSLAAAGSDLDGRELEEQLERLMKSQLIIRTRREPEASYRFRHALIRDEAYQSLVRSDRQQHHKRIAECFESDFRDEAAARPELVAHHWLESGDESKGVFYLVLAARRAVRTSANVEAVRQVDRALSILEGWPASPARAQFELGLQTIKGSALIATRGYASQEVRAAFDRARKIADAVGDSPQVVPVLHGLWLFHMVRSDRSATVELAEHLRQIGETSDDVTARLFGLTVAGIQAFFEGRIEPAVDYVERAYALYDPKQHEELAVTYSLGTAGVARSNAASCLWLMGFPDRARRLARKVLDDARRSQHPFTLAGVGVMSSMTFRLCRDYETVAQMSGEAYRIAVEQEFPLWIGGALTGVGISQAAMGSPDKGIATIREGQRVFRSTGAQTNMVYVTTDVADLLLAHGRLDEAEEAVNEALALVETNLDRFYAPDAWRVRAAVTLARSGNAAEARDQYQRAIDLARGMNAKSLELRAATGLARLEQGAGDPARAREVLQPLYGWFTEGFDTADLREARALLEELSG